MFMAFRGVKAKKLFVEFQGHWRATAIDAWCQGFIGMLRREEDALQKR